MFGSFSFGVVSLICCLKLILDLNVLSQWLQILNQFVFMLSKTRSGPESFVAKVAGDDNSFEMVCFNVIFYGTAHAFLSTNFAPIS